MNSNLLNLDWNSRGHTFGIFKDSPGQVWADFVHKTDELVVLAEGEIEIEIEGKSQRPKITETKTSKTKTTQAHKNAKNNKSRILYENKI